MTDWLITDGLPFNAVNGKGFKKMMKKVNAAFNPPCYTTLKQDMGLSYNTAIELMKNYIEEMHQLLRIFGHQELKTGILA